MDCRVNSEAGSRQHTGSVVVMECVPWTGLCECHCMCVGDAASMTMGASLEAVCDSSQPVCESWCVQKFLRMVVCDKFFEGLDGRASGELSSCSG